MSQPIISVENLSKSYLIGHQGPRERYTSLRDTISNHGKNFSRRTIDTLRGKQMLQGDSQEEFWALKDVSFDVQQGEVLGIIGRNGAGKSTLLKVLSRITEPTSGRVTLRGRVASLLEVGTGFHPELSGRENIFLNGAILGMSRREIKSKFDEIVNFAGVEKFLDTPVKRYSSGMYVRLAFAVAAHLEPEILVVDEVLAVGDADFQKKCMGKMQDVAKEGRTVIFVSHTMGAISSLCSRCMLMEKGELVTDGIPTDVISTYYRGGKDSPFRADFTSGKKISGEGATLLSAIISDEFGNPLESALITKPLQIRMRYRIDEAREGFFYPNFHITDSNSNCVFISPAEGPNLPNQPGEYEAICNIPAHFFNDVTYFVGLALTLSDGESKVAFYEKDALCLHLKDPLEETLYTKRNGYAGPMPGAVRPNFTWDIIKQA
jgi:lipopolysaccharide transport system ATP-binding protein